MACNLTTGEVEYIDKTIAELQAENAKLREEVRHLKKGDVLHVLTDQELAEQQKHKREMQASIKALDDENAELRELIADLWKYIYIGTARDGQRLHDRTRELGVDA